MENTNANHVRKAIVSATSSRPKQKNITKLYNFKHETISRQSTK